MLVCGANVLLLPDSIFFSFCVADSGHRPLLHEYNFFFFSGEKEKVSRGTCGDSGPDQGHARAGGRGEKLISAVNPRYTYMLTFHATEKQNKADFF